MPVTDYYSADGELFAEETGGVRTDYLTDALGSVVEVKAGWDNHVAGERSGKGRQAQR